MCAVGGGYGGLPVVVAGDYQFTTVVLVELNTGH